MNFATLFFAWLCTPDARYLCVVLLVLGVAPDEACVLNPSMSCYLNANYLLGYVLLALGDAQE